MKHLLQKQAAAVFKFIREKGKPLPRVHRVHFIGELECMNQNILNMLVRQTASTKQRRERKAELEKLLAAFKGLSLDTRELLALSALDSAKSYKSMTISEGIARARGRHKWSARATDTDAVQSAVESKLLMLSRASPRGPGHMAQVRRRFVREAAVLYLMAGFNTLNANKGQPFMKWCERLDDVFSMRVTYDLVNANERVSLRPATLEEIGATKPARKAWELRKLQWIERKYPT